MTDQHAQLKAILKSLVSGAFKMPPDWEEAPDMKETARAALDDLNEQQRNEELYERAHRVVGTFFYLACDAEIIRTCNMLGPSPMFPDGSPCVYGRPGEFLFLVLEDNEISVKYHDMAESLVRSWFTLMCADLYIATAVRFLGIIPVEENYDKICTVWELLCEKEDLLATRMLLRRQENEIRAEGRRCHGKGAPDLPDPPGDL